MGSDNPCIRLSYHRGTHYNSLYDPYKPTCGVGLGMPNLVPGLADNNLMKEATRQSENFHIEQVTMWYFVYELFLHNISAKVMLQTK